MISKFLSTVLALFTLIGCVIVLSLDFENTTALFLCVALYVFIPGYGAYGIWQQNRIAVGVSLLFFLFQSVRNLSYESVFPVISPISISFPFILPNGQKFLIDFFAITMAFICVLVFEQLTKSSKTT
jgi:hypothetical protein